MQTIEEFTSNVILQKPVKITVAGKDFFVAPPTTTTLIEASKYISFLPEIKPLEKEENATYYVLANAKECESVGNIVAILILGAKNFITKKEVVKRRFLWLKKVETVEIDNRKELAKLIMDKLTIEELNSLLIKLFELQNVGFFLSTINFLREMAILKTK